MDVLQHVHLNIGSLSKQYQRVVKQLRTGEFAAADVKKMRGTGLYRAKLNDKARLLFSFASFEEKKVLLMLEILQHHNYAASRYLGDATVSADDFVAIERPEFDENPPFGDLRFFNKDNLHFHLLDKVLSFDELQEQIYLEPLPLVLIGSAGSGKTAITIEKLRDTPGRSLYISLSPYLVENARRLYYANNASDDDPDVDFLSFKELLETIRIPSGKEITFKRFEAWASAQKEVKARDARKLFEEFRGVLSGAALETEYLSLEEYQQLGVRESIISPEDRERIYQLFTRYVTFLQRDKLYDPSMLASRYRQQLSAEYDAVFVDEVQDFTLAQLALVLSLLRLRNGFLLCGDANQIVHPNFFSWAKVKAFLYTDGSFEQSPDCIRILQSNYRNSRLVTDAANRVLRLKQQRFGSVDRESNFLITCDSPHTGEFHLLEEKPSVLKRLNDSSRQSTKVAVIVLFDDEKAKARQLFDTPLVFSIHEAKGLEYDSVILFNLVSAAEREFREIAADCTPDDIAGDNPLHFARAKDKSDKSLDIYKFYINAFYVGITRALQKVYLVERQPTHTFFNALGIIESQQDLEIKAEQSSVEEWQREANKLELQGKAEQAEDIRRRILSIKEVPWQPITLVDVGKYYDAALRNEKVNKKDQLRLVEVSTLYYLPHITNELAEDKVSLARRSQQERTDYVMRQHFPAYTTSNTNAVLDDVKRYGANFRNKFNLTPLMVAARAGNLDLIERLLDVGASLSEEDPTGLTAHRQLFAELLFQPRWGKGNARTIGSIYPKVVPPTIKIRAEGRLLKLEQHMIEHFLFSFLMFYLPRKWTLMRGYYLEWAFTARELAENLENFPPAIISERRVRREYISSVLSRNEIDSSNPYSRRMLKRVRRGEYAFNPNLAVAYGDEWVNVYDAMRTKDILAIEGSEQSARANQVIEFFRAKFAKDSDASTAESSDPTGERQVA